MAFIWGEERLFDLLRNNLHHDLFPFHEYYVIDNRSGSVAEVLAYVENDISYYIYHDLSSEREYIFQCDYLDYSDNIISNYYVISF